jgi:hypothetical protein
MEAEPRRRRKGVSRHVRTLQDVSKTSILVLVNERLRRALNEAGLDIDDLARATGASNETARRWITPGRTPQRRYRVVVARLVKRDEADLWPEVATPAPDTATSEVVNVYPGRDRVPADLWRGLLEHAEREVNLLGTALLYLFETPGFLTLLRGTPAKVRIALADPHSVMVAKRDDELGLDGSLPTRILTSIGHLRQFEGYPGIDVRVHTTGLYCSLYHVDEEMLVTPHVYGRPGRHDTPLLHLRHREQHGIFDSYLYHFDDVFNKAAVPIWPPTEPIWDEDSGTWKTAPWWDLESRKLVNDE